MRPVGRGRGTYESDRTLGHAIDTEAVLFSPQRHMKLPRLSSRLIGALERLTIMSLRIRWRLLPTLAASFGLATNSILPFPALAQTAVPPPPAPTADLPGATSGDPPARVGWLSQLSGTVSFHSAGQDQWVTATQNYPVTTGDAVWTQPQSAASIMVDSSRMAMAAGTEVTAQEINQNTVDAVLSQGEIFLNLVAMQPGQTVVIQTPRGTAQITGNGEYEIYAGDTTTPTYVTAVVGSIQFTGLGSSAPQTVGAQQTAEISGDNPVQVQLVAMQQDEFLTNMLQQVAPPPPPTAAQAPPVCAQMTGAAVLTQYGSWKPQPQYGTVWFPHVASGWVPYREGHWAYVQPWGWTWVDNAPWGFAPFHYWRWSQFDGQWGWIPQPVAEPGYGQGYGYGYNYSESQGYYAQPGYVAPAPAYSPALVTFLGAAAGAAVGVLAANAWSNGSIGWAPLGPREPYYPPYRVSPRYFQSYNQPYVPNYNQFVQRNVNIVNNRVEYRNTTINNFNNGAGQAGREGQFANRQGATFVPTAAMMNSRQVRGEVQPVPQGELRPFRAIDGQALPRPTVQTAGVDPALARRLNLPQVPGAALRSGAPGPAIRQVPGVERGHAPPPPLVPHAQFAPSFRGGAPQAPGVPAPGIVPGAPGNARGGVPLPGQPQAPRIGEPNLRPNAPVPGVPQLPRPGVTNSRPGVVAPPVIPGAAAPRPGVNAAPAIPGATNGAPRPQFRPAAPGAAPREPGLRNQPAPGAVPPRGAPPTMPVARPPSPNPAAPRQALPPAAEARPQAPRPQAPRMQAPQVAAPRPPQQAPRAEAPRPPAPQRMEAPRAAAPRPVAPRMEAPRPPPRMEAPRQAPRMEAPRQAPRAEVRPPGPQRR
jgi:hypothetical protein